MRSRRLVWSLQMSDALTTVASARGLDGVHPDSTSRAASARPTTMRLRSRLASLPFRGSRRECRHRCDPTALADTPSVLALGTYPDAMQVIDQGGDVTLRDRLVLRARARQRSLRCSRPKHSVGQISGCRPIDCFRKNAMRLTNPTSAPMCALCGDALALSRGR